MGEMPAQSHRHSRSDQLMAAWRDHTMTSCWETHATVVDGDVLPRRG